MVICCSCVKKNYVSVESYIQQHRSELSIESDAQKTTYCLLSKLKNVVNSQHYQAIDGIQVLIIPSDSLIVRSYPPDTIVISSSFFDLNSPCRPRTEGAFLGVIAHEMAHIIFKHTQMRQKWVITNNEIYAGNAAKQLGNIASVASSFTSCKLNIDFGNAVFTPSEMYNEWFCESVADLWAIKLLTLLNIDPVSYRDYLRQIADNSLDSGCRYNDIDDLTLNRIERINAYLVQPSTDDKHNLDSIRLVFSETGKKPSFVTLKNYSNMNKSLWKDGAGSVHGEFYEFLRSVNYWKCATRQSREWCKEHVCMHDVVITGFEGEALRDRDGNPITSTVIDIPVMINNSPSLLFEGYELKMH